MKRLSKVFVVDDDPAVRASFEAILTQQGYDVRGFPTAEDFLAQHHPTQVGCVLVDLAMPGMGGSELLKRLHESGSLLSIVIISGLVDADMLDVHRQAVRTLLIEVLGDGASPPVPLLVKPYEMSTLLQMVEDGIAGSVRRRAKRLGTRPERS